MECLFYTELNKVQSQIILQDEEFLHAKALRIKIGENVMITNGKGLSTIAKFEEFSKKSATFSCGEFINNFGESAFRIGLAMGILHNKDRFEFAIEKAVELGVTDFYPLILKNNQLNIIKHDRLIQKSISAMKQCKRSVVMEIHPEIELQNLVKNFKNYDNTYVLDEFGDKIIDSSQGSFLIIIGPEGGLEKSEIEFLQSNDAKLLSLMNRRLRSETAAVVGLSILLKS